MSFPPAAAGPSPLHFARLECKYVLSAAQRQVLEAALQPFLESDAHAHGGVYGVRSLYFDDPAWSAFHAKMDGLRTRSKFRLRTYARHCDDPAAWFLEQKGRQDGVVWKHRTPIARAFDPTRRGTALVSAVLANAMQSPILDRFASAVLRQRLAPVVLVDYRRRPYTSPFAPGFRVTFDDELWAAASDQLFGPALARHRLLPGCSVLEIKFAHAVPAWFHAVVQDQELQRRSLSKVCSAILALGLAQAR